jgi:uncharacterized protein (DUF2141 family)
MRLLASALLFAVSMPAVAFAGDLTVTIDGIGDDHGSVLGALYNSETTFMNQPAAKAWLKLKAASGQVQYVFHNLPAGKYALSVFHDENDNGKLDRNDLGVPTEGYGFSNDAQGVGGPPKWGQAAFDFDGPSKSITVSLSD